MIITTALANEIVARAMAIIHHNVNVIDHHGQIIASGERHRIGEQHEIAREVIRTGKRICINNTAEAARFQNVHPGINHPIIYDDRVVMVVGISGDPAAISRYAELAVLTAELLVRQAIEMRETNWRQRLRDTLFGQYLDQGASPAGQEALHRLMELGFAFDAPLVPVVVTVQVEQHQLSEILSTLLREFSQLAGVRDVILLGSNEILILNTLSESQETLLRGIEFVLSNQISHYHIGIGVQADSAPDIREAIRFARSVIEVGSWKTAIWSIFLSITYASCLSMIPAKCCWIPSAALLPITPSRAKRRCCWGFIAIRSPIGCSRLKSIFSSIRWSSPT